MRNTAKKTVDSARVILDATLIAIVEGDADIALLRDSDGQDFAAVMVGDQVRLVICDPPLTVGSATLEQ